jgi:transposase-like protein
MSYPHINDAFRKTVVDAVMGGLPNHAAATKFGINPKTVSRWLSRAGNANRKLLPAEVKAEAAQRYASGQRPSTVGRLLGIAPQSVISAARAAGHPLQFGDTWRPPYRPSTVTEIQAADIERLHAEGKGDNAISRDLGITARIIARYRRRHKLATNVPSRRPADVKRVRVRLVAPKVAKVRAVAPVSVKPVIVASTIKPAVASVLPRAVLTVVGARQAVPVYVGRSEPCCWPVRTVKTATGRERHILCDEPTIGGRNNPYCAKHRAASVDARANARVRGHRTSAVAPVTVHTSLPQWSDDATRALR